MSEETKNGNYIVQAWLVILLAILYGVGLAGMQINLADKIAENKRTNANLESEIAALLAKENVEGRAFALGYETVAPENIEYLVVPSYEEPTPFQLAMAPAPKHHAPTVPPEYTQSLLDWIDQNMFTPAVASSGGTR